MIRTFLKKKGFTLIELMIVVAIIGILAAIAIPNFVRFQARSKQGEAKTNLKALFTAQKAYYGEKDKYLTRGDIIGWTPEQGNRYGYMLSATAGLTWTRPGTMPTGGFDAITNDTTRFGAAVTVPVTIAGPTGPAGAAAVGIVGTCPACDFGAAAAGNVDNDPKQDSWFIGTFDGTNSASATGACAVPDPQVTSGVPHNI